MLQRKDMKEVQENCGFCVASLLHDCNNFLKSSRHRGRDAVGIGAVGDNFIDVVKWLGTPESFDISNLHEILQSKNYHTYLGHIRYTTSGNKNAPLEERLAEAHPHVIGGTAEYCGSHVIIRNCDAIMVCNGQVNAPYLDDVDPTLLKTKCDTESLLQFFYQYGELELLRRIPGAYSLALADRRRKEVIVLRDRHGMRPASLGKKDGNSCVASEMIALWENGGYFIKDISPGSAYYIDSKGSYRSEKVVEPELQHCFFEWNYVAHIRSHLSKISVLTVRCRLGEELAAEFRPEDIDLVSFLPSCPEMAAISYADSTSLPFMPIFYKKRKERAFLGSSIEERAASIRENLYLLDNAIPFIRDKNILIVDDSIVRGNNSPYAIKLLKEKGGVKNVYLASYTPPIGIIGEDGIARGCEFGVDMPPTDNFIARGRKVEEISKILGVEVGYLSVEGMLRVFDSVGMPRGKLCTYCIGGKHPFS